VRVIFCTSRTADIKGIDNHHVNGIGTFGVVVNTQKGPVIAIMHQYALLGKGASIQSPSKLEWYKNDVNDKSIHVPGGCQRLTTLDGYVIPPIIKDGLARLDIWPHMDHEYKTFPHVCLTYKVEWDPTVLDHEFTDESQWGEDNPAIVDLISASAYNEFGQYRHRVEVNKHLYLHVLIVTTLMTIPINLLSTLTQLRLSPTYLQSMFLKPSIRNLWTTESSNLSLTG
jgi:hypothetical protein